MTISQPKTHRTERVEIQEVRPTEIPWINSPQLEDRQVIRRSPKVISYTHTTWDGIWVRYFDWFGFRPRTLAIEAWKDSSSEYAVTSNGMIDEKGLATRRYIRPDSDRNPILSSFVDSAVCFFLRDEVNDISWGTFVSYGSDGVNINVEAIAFDAVIVITAYE